MYIFRFPKQAEMPFTYENLDNYIKAGKCEYERKVGTTVTVQHLCAGQIQIKLYDTIIADLLSNGNLCIFESINNHGSQATGAWVGKILQDNGVHHGVWREKGKYEVAGKAFARNI